MKNNSLRRAFAVLLLSATACGKSADTPAVPSPETAPTAPAPKQTPEAAFTEEELARAFQAGAKAVLARHGGKRLHVRGTVESADIDRANGEPHISLLRYLGQGEFAPGKAVTCDLLPAEEARVTRLAQGQRVTIRGVLLNTPAAPMLTECELVEVGPSPTIRVGVKQLAEAFRADKDKARQEYRHRSVLVDGVVVLVGGEAGTAFHFLVADPADAGRPPAALLAVACPCSWNDRLRARLAAVGRGQKIEVLGSMDCDTAPGLSLTWGKLLAISGDKLAAPSPAEAPPVALTDAKLGEELLKDPLGAWLKYADRRLEVDGVVEGPALLNPHRLELRGYQSKADPLRYQNVGCEFPASMNERIKRLSRGQRVKVRGFLQNNGVNLDLTRCELIDRGRK